MFVHGIRQNSDGKPVEVLKPQDKQLTSTALTPIGLNAKTANLIQTATILVPLVGAVIAFPLSNGFLA
jgi:hypothetical protein